SGLVVVRRKIGVGAGDAQVARTLVCHREKPPDTTGDRILRHRRLCVMTELVEARVAEPESQLPRVLEMVRQLAVEDLERSLDSGAGGDGGLRGTTEVGIIEVDQAIGRGPHLAPLAQLLPVEQGGM